MRTAIFPGRYDQLDAIREFAAQTARDAGMDDSDVYSVELATDEACTNIIEHAYLGENKGDIECTCDYDDVNLTIVLRDHGKSFDPSAISEPDIDAGLENRNVGGLGLYLIKQVMDEVRFEPLGELGNLLTMVKRIKSKKQKNQSKKASTPWGSIVALGEDLVHLKSLSSWQEKIIATGKNLLDAKITVWLDETPLLLPDMEPAGTYSKHPISKEMSEVVKTGIPFISPENQDLLVYPIKFGGGINGAIQAKRSSKSFTEYEKEILEGMAGHISLALVTSQRFVIDQWRIEQLSLVRRVGSQIANVLEMSELIQRVTKLIQRTFNYYYVAIFTYEAGQNVLSFRSSSGKARGRGKPLKVSVGEGLVGTVVECGDEVITNDVNSESRFRFVDLLAETQSEAALPLKIEDQILGVLDVQSDKVGAFHPNDLMVLRALADNIAIAINNARLYGELQTRADHLSMVAEVGKSVTSTLDLDELLNQVVFLIHDRLKYKNVQIFTVHPNRRQIIYEAGNSETSESIKGYILDLDNEEGVIGRVARNGLTNLENDLDQKNNILISPLFFAGTQSELTIPLLFDKKVVGVLDLQSDKKGAFTSESRFLCEAIADNVAVAIHNADLFRTERWRRQVADSLREVAGLISAEVSLDDVLDRVLRELEHNLPCDVAAVWLLEGEDLVLAHVHGADSIDVDAASQKWPEAYEYLGATLTSEQPVIRKPEDPLGPTGAACGFSADYSSIAAALRVGDQPLGVITLSHHSSGRYGHEAQAITVTFANYASVAIENARLYDSAQEQAYASAALLQIAEAVANSNNLEDTISSVVRITPILVGVKACAIYILNDGLFTPTQAYGFSEDVESTILEKPFSAGEFTLLDKVKETHNMVVGRLDSVRPESYLNPDLSEDQQDSYFNLETGNRLLIGFPLLVKNEIFGCMLVEEASDSIRFRQKRIEIINSIAQQIALNVQNEHLEREMMARELLEHEIELARQIQKTFLPEKLPEFSGWDMDATWITAKQVGGDFYDVFELQDDQLGIFIADVADKGIPAALFMALTRTLVRAVVYDTKSPAEALRRVNALIIPDNKQEMFVTAMYGVISINSGQFTYANAGHNPPLWIRKSNRNIELLRTTGAALGIIENVKIDEKTIHINPADFLLLYTDGLTEAFSPKDETYGENRLLDLLKKTEISSPNKILQKVENSVKKFMGTRPPADDLTMLAVMRTESAK